MKHITEDSINELLRDQTITKSIKIERLAKMTFDLVHLLDTQSGELSRNRIEIECLRLFP